MRAKIEAGASIDFVTESEVKKVLEEHAESWRAERARGVKWRKFSAQTVGDGATFQIGGETASRNQDALGPDPGFVWAVTRLAVSGPGFSLSADTFDIFVDDVSPTRMVLSGQFNVRPYPVGTIVLMGGETLVITGTATVAADNVYLSGQAVEVPAPLSWMLLGR